MKKIKQIFGDIKKFFQKIIVKPNATFKNFKPNKTGVIIVVAAILLGSLYYFRFLFISATVNGMPISRFEVIKRLETQNGKAVLDSIITEAVVNQEAKKLGINITEADIDADYNKLKDSLSKTGQDLDNLLSLQGITKADFRSNIKLRLTVEKILAGKIAVTDDEVTKYIEDNKASMPADTNADDLKASVRQQLEGQKLSQEFQTWLDAAKAKANIIYLVKY